jgi:cell division protein FtsW
MKTKLNIKFWWKQIDRVNFALILMLAIIGIILSISLSDSYLFLNKHLIFSIIGIFIMISVSYFEIKFLRRFSLLSIILFILILFIILFLDYEVNGSKRWLKIYGFSLQPSEFIKPFFFLLSAWFISQGISGRNSYFVVLIISFVTICGLIILQPDFGTAFLIAITFFCQLFIAGLSMVLMIFALVSLLFLSAFSYYYFDHIQKRVDAFINPTANTDQIDLSLQAFKSGGLFGKGPGQGILKEKIPSANTDFIFAVAGEELGFIFCSLIVLLILVIIIRFLLKLLKMSNPFEIIAVVGLTCSFGLQSLFNICSSLALIPTKGMTLPFVSYGGSSMISSAVLFGCLLSLTRQRNEEK